MLCSAKSASTTTTRVCVVCGGEAAENHWRAVCLHAAPQPSPILTRFPPHLFLGIAKWLNAFHTHTNTCTHTYTRAQCCDLDSFWFLSADDWQVLNERSLERLPSRPVHQPSTYNARTHTHTNTRACPLTPIFIHTHTHTHAYVVSLCSLQTFSVPFPRLDQFVHCSGSVWQSPGDGLGLALLLCSYEAVLFNTEGMSAAPLFNKAQYEPV